MAYPHSGWSHCSDGESQNFIMHWSMHESMILNSLKSHFPFSIAWERESLHTEVGNTHPCYVTILNSNGQNYGISVD